MVIELRGPLATVRMAGLPSSSEVNHAPDLIGYESCSRKTYSHLLCILLGIGSHEPTP